MPPSTRRSSLFPDFLRLNLENDKHHQPDPLLSFMPPVFDDYLKHRRPSMPATLPLSGGGHEYGGDYVGDRISPLSDIPPVRWPTPSAVARDVLSGEDYFSRRMNAELAALCLGRRIGFGEEMVVSPGGTGKFGELEDEDENDECERMKKSELYRTEMCRTFEEKGYCPYGNKCEYAHSEAELRPIYRPWNFKTKPCRTFHEKGHCPYGKRCHYRHAGGPDEIPKNVIIGPPPPNGKASPSLTPTGSMASASKAVFDPYARRVSDSGLQGLGVSGGLGPGIASSASNTGLYLTPEALGPRRSAPAVVLDAELSRLRALLRQKQQQELAMLGLENLNLMGGLEDELRPYSSSTSPLPSVSSTVPSPSSMLQAPQPGGSSTSTSLAMPLSPMPGPVGPNGNKGKQDELLPRDLMEQLGCEIHPLDDGAATEEWKELRGRLKALGLGDNTET
ncbi:uncharacterized protein VTP21DRAFT_11252 [Calcarisporiella thermophila]|uniref:uncharacterized protein n=1 Tax=Calcarisporiella thermophila TaxID=911321 RepID=UPI003742D8A2